MDARPARIFTSGRERGADRIGRRRRVSEDIGFPEAHDGPAALGQQSVVAPITDSVVFDLATQ